MGLRIAKEDLDLPAGPISLQDLFCRELGDRNIGNESGPITELKSLFFGFTETMSSAVFMEFSSKAGSLVGRILNSHHADGHRYLGSDD